MKNNTTERRINNLANQLKQQIPSQNVEQINQQATNFNTMANQTKNPVRVCVTGAAGQIAYALLPKILAGEMFGPDQPIILHLLEIPYAEQALEGVCMELIDSAYPLMAGLVPTVKPEVGFKDVDYAIFVGAFPRKQGMNRADLLQKNAGIFGGQGKVLNEVAKKSVKILVVGNPANTNCLILKEFAPSIPAQNFSALTRLDHNRATAQLSLKSGAPITDIKNVIIWGNHSKTQYPDVNQGTIGDKTIRQVINNDAYLNDEFITTVQYRGAKVIEKRKLSSATSAAKAICDHMHDWVLGTPKGVYVSMAVPSDGSYGVPEGVIFSYPVQCNGGNYTIVKGLTLDEFSKGKIAITQKELFEERETALALFKN